MTFFDYVKIAIAFAALVTMMAIVGNGHGPAPCLPGSIEALFTSCPRKVGSTGAIPPTLSPWPHTRAREAAEGGQVVRI